MGIVAESEDSKKDRCEWNGMGLAGTRGASDRIVMREERMVHSPWLLFLVRFLRSSLRSCANPNSKSFSLIFGFGRFILRPVKIKSTGSIERAQCSFDFYSVVGSADDSGRQRLRGRIACGTNVGDDRQRFQRDLKLESIKAYEGALPYLRVTQAKCNSCVDQIVAREIPISIGSGSRHLVANFVQNDTTKKAPRDKTEIPSQFRRFRNGIFADAYYLRVD